MNASCPNGSGLTLFQLATALTEGGLSSEALVSGCLDRIHRANPMLNAFVALAENARSLARDADARRRSGLARGPLDGIPLAVKDLFDVAGLATHGGSNARPQTPATASSWPVKRLEDAGMIVLGKTATVELGCGGWGTQSASPIPRNPWNAREHCVPGGSSSGSAVAVAAGLVPFALGSDTGGSVRIPASFCGIVGFKPSPGLVPLDGAIPYSPTHDAIGLLGLTVEDVRTVFMALWRGGGTPGGSLQGTVGAVRIGELDDADLHTASPDVGALYRAALAKLADAGHRIGRFHSPERFEAYSVLAGDLALREAYAVHGAAIEAAPNLFGSVVRDRILSGRAKPPHEAMIEDRRQHQHRFDAAMRGFDVIALPTCPDGAIAVSKVDESRLPTAFTRFANYLDLPALSIPIGFTAQGMPVGLQFAARRDDDAMLLSFGSETERRLDSPVPKYRAMLCHVAA
ncbi:amidase [Azospirillum sp. TSO22-1]|uniref:amidase n=1 Tax=Azospirillum sp. TSO22-1 TaxID=716789 RepID=UPI000D64CA88|nr:amidase [Azospirillum sp. TSO22-1]